MSEQVKPEAFIKIEHMLDLSEDFYSPIPRLNQKIPFGYAIHPEDEKTLIPIVFELETLDKAKVHLKEGHSLRTVAKWIHETTGRYISHEGLKRRVESDRRKVGKTGALKRWATVLHATIEKIKEHDERYGNDTSWYEEWWRTGKNPFGLEHTEQRKFERNNREWGKDYLSSEPRTSGDIPSSE